MHTKPVSIVIATYGDKKWAELAKERAFPSAELQLGCEIILHHEPFGTAASTRNNGVAQATREWIIMCDADDELEPGYVDACLKSKGDLRYPLVRYIPNRYDLEKKRLPNPIVLPMKCLLRGNYMVIGTMMQKSLFEKVGGFTELESWEDWFLFLQLTYLGAKPLLAPAIYRVYRSPGSRVSVKDTRKVFNDILTEFKFWALSYNGGITEDQEYRAFFLSPKLFYI